MIGWLVRRVYNSTDGRYSPYTTLSVALKVFNIVPGFENFTTYILSTLLLLSVINRLHTNIYQDSDCQEDYIHLHDAPNPNLCARLRGLYSGHPPLNAPRGTRDFNRDPGHYSALRGTGNVRRDVGQSPVL